MVTKSNFVIPLMTHITFVSSTSFHENFMFMVKVSRNSKFDSSEMVLILTDLKGSPIYKTVNYERIIGNSLKIAKNASIFYAIKDIHSRKIRNESLKSRTEKTKSLKQKENERLFIEQILKEYKEFKLCHLRCNENEFANGEDGSFNSKIIQGVSFMIKVDELKIMGKRQGFNVYLKREVQKQERFERKNTVSIDYTTETGREENYEIDKDFLPEVTKTFSLNPKLMNYSYEPIGLNLKSKDMIRLEAERKMNNLEDSDESQFEESESSERSDELDQSLQLDDESNFFVANKEVEGEDGFRIDKMALPEEIEEEEVDQEETAYEVNLKNVLFCKYNFKTNKIEKVEDENEHISQFQKALSANVNKENILFENGDYPGYNMEKEDKSKGQAEAMEKQLKTKLTSKDQIGIFTTLNYFSFLYFAAITVLVSVLFSLIIGNLKDVRGAFNIMNLAIENSFVETQLQFQLLESKLLKKEDYVGFIGTREQAITQVEAELKLLAEKNVNIETELNSFKIRTEKLKEFENGIYDFPFLVTSETLIIVERQYEYQNSIEQALLSYINNINSGDEDTPDSQNIESNYLFSSFNTSILLKFYRSWVYKRLVEHVAESTNLMVIILFIACFIVILVFSLAINYLYMRILKLKEDYLKLFFKVDDEFIYSSIENCENFLKSLEDNPEADMSNGFELSVNKLSKKQQRQKEIKNFKAGLPNQKSRKDKNKITKEQKEIIKYLIVFFILIGSMLIFGFVYFLTLTSYWTELSVFSFSISTNFVYKNIMLNSLPMLALYKDKVTVLNGDGLEYLNHFNRNLNQFDDWTINVRP